MNPLDRLPRLSASKRCADLRPFLAFEVAGLSRFVVGDSSPDEFPLDKMHQYRRGSSQHALAASASVGCSGRGISKIGVADDRQVSPLRLADGGLADAPAQADPGSRLQSQVSPFPDWRERTACLALEKTRPHGERPVCACYADAAGWAVAMLHSMSSECAIEWETHMPVTLPTVVLTCRRMAPSHAVHAYGPGREARAKLPSATTCSPAPRRGIRRACRVPHLRTHGSRFAGSASIVQA